MFHVWVGPCRSGLGSSAGMNRSLQLRPCGRVQTSNCFLKARAGEPSNPHATGLCLATHQSPSSLHVGRTLMPLCMPRKAKRRQTFHWAGSLQQLSMLFWSLMLPNLKPGAVDSFSASIFRFQLLSSCRCAGDMQKSGCCFEFGDPSEVLLYRRRPLLVTETTFRDPTH